MLVKHRSMTRKNGDSYFFDIKMLRRIFEPEKEVTGGDN
jgi:hypothetical protein